jgi:hypothetical protein
VSVLGEGVVDRVVDPLVRHDLMHAQSGARGRGAPEKPAPRKFALPNLHL